MAVSKKPRHGRKKKGTLTALIFPRKAIAELKAELTKIELLCECKLHTGMLVFDEVALIRDVLNACTWFAARWRDKVQIDQETADTFARAQNAFHDFYQRGIDAGAVDDRSVRFVCRGHEITDIKDGVAIAGPFLQDLVEMDPSDFCKTFFAMKDFLRDKGAGRIRVEREKMEKIIDRSVRR